MKNKEREEQDGWADRVPATRARGPYRDYGWEPHQSALPEFRDPDVHFVRDEWERLQPWQRFRPRRIARPGDLLEDQGRQPGPHVGKGPRNYSRTDERIYEVACERMTRHGRLDAHDIDVEVQDGEVTLTGNVSDRRAKRLAEDIVDSVYGVRDVHNRLQPLERRSTPERWTDRVKNSGVYPASEMEQAPDDAETQGMASFGQGERGAEGYYDHGDSELYVGRGDDEETGSS